jgi:hypothetical protein
MCYLGAILAMATTMVMIGCPGGSDESQVDLQGREIALNSANVEALHGETFTFPDGAVFDPSLAGRQVTLAFNAGAGGGTEFALTDTITGNVATGDVGFGSCFFVVTGGTLLPLNTRRDFDECGIQITSGTINVGGSGEGSIVLVLVFGNIRGTSLPVIVVIEITANGQIIINGIDVGEQVTGTTGTGS